MKNFIKFVLVFSAIILLSVFLAPVLFQVMPFKFERIFNRLIMIFSLVAVLGFVRIRKSTLEHYGLIWKSDSLVLFAKTWLISVAVLVLLTVLRVSSGNGNWSSPNVSLTGWGERLILAFGASVLIGVIEEFFFRGFVFLTIKEKWQWGFRASLLVTSAFYAVIHFISEKKPFIGPEPTWLDSLKLIKAPFMSFTQWDQIWPGAVGLFILGVVLILLFVRSGSLYPSIGLHAGCVFFLKTAGLFVNFKGDGGLWYGSGKIYDGILGWIFIALLGFISLNLTKKRDPVTASS